MSEKKLSEKKSGRGAVCVTWGAPQEIAIARMIASLHKYHPELPIQNIKLESGSLRDKAAIWDISRFSETLYLDVDTVVMDRLDFGFEMAGRHGLACTICECPWLRRYDAKYGDGIEYNTGVIFFTEKAKPFFDTWKRLGVSHPGEITFHAGNRRKVMSENDQLSFGLAAIESGITPFVLPMNWNFRPQWHKTYFGPIKIWHDYRDVPETVQEICEDQKLGGAETNPLGLIDFHEFRWTKSHKPLIKVNLSDRPKQGYVSKSFAESITFEAESCSEIFAPHILQKFPHTHTYQVLKVWADALAPGGVLRLTVPNALWIAHKMIQGDPTFNPELAMLGSQHGDDKTASLFRRDALRQAMIMVGLRHIGGDDELQQKDEKGIAMPHEIVLRGTKPVEMEIKNTVAVLSCPRFGPTAHFFAANRAFKPLGIDYEGGGGVYWHQSLPNLLEAADKSYDFCVTLDFDSAFTAQNVRDLYRLMIENPRADAICAIELRREDGVPLVAMIDSKGNRVDSVAREDVDKEIVPIRAGHFGLTIIRLASLRKMPHPWFVGKPGPTGRWDEGRVDPDVAFWHAFGDIGLKLFAAPYVGIGHIEQVVTWCNDDFKIHRQTMNDWMGKGVPLEARQ